MNAKCESRVCINSTTDKWKRHRLEFHQVQHNFRGTIFHRCMQSKVRQLLDLSCHHTCTCSHCMLHCHWIWQEAHHQTDLGCHHCVSLVPALALCGLWLLQKDLGRHSVFPLSCCFFLLAGFARLCDLITSVSSSSFFAGVSVKIRVHFIFWVRAFALRALAFGKGLISSGVITVLLLAAGGDWSEMSSPALLSQPTIAQCSSTILSAHKSLACEYMF